jgi:hypothetical protein
MLSQGGSSNGQANKIDPGYRQSYDARRSTAVHCPLRLFDNRIETLSFLPRGFCRKALPIGWEQKGQEPQPKRRGPAASWSQSQKCGSNIVIHEREYKIEIQLRSIAVKCRCAILKAPS